MRTGVTYTTGPPWRKKVARGVPGFCRGGEAGRLGSGCRADLGCGGVSFWQVDSESELKMKIGLVGYQGSGKSTLFEWLTGVPADPALSHASQTAMATVQDPRVPQLCEIYQPRKITNAAIEIVDTPGLSRTHEGNAARLGFIRSAGCLVHVIGAFDGTDVARDLEGFYEDLLLADLEAVSNRVARLEEALSKPRPNQEEQKLELEAIRPLLAVLEEGRPLTDIEMTPDQEKVTRSFQLLTLKQRLVVVNTADDETNPERFTDLSTEETRVLAFPVGLEAELSRMEPEEAAEFRDEMGVPSYDRDGFLRALMDHSGQMLFFTAGEIRTWLIRKGATAVEAADSIHSDLARGFIRAETMSCDDLLRLGSEREVKANNLMRQETKDYIMQDGDIINVRFSV